MTWSAKRAISRYRPLGPKHVLRDQYVRRTTACGGCPRRQGDRCSVVGLPIIDLARGKENLCPQGRWPGEAAPPQPAAPQPAAPQPAAPQPAAPQPAAPEPKQRAAPKSQSQGPVRVGWILPRISHGGVSRGVMTLLERCDPEEVLHVGIALQGPLSYTHGGLAERMAKFCPILAPRSIEPLPCMQATSDFRSAAQAVVERSDVIQLWGIETPKELAEIDWKGKPVVVRSHGSCEWTRKMLARILPYGTHFMAVSQSAIGPFPLEYQPKVSVVENGVDQERCSPRLGRSRIRSSWGIADGEVVIGYHGRLSPEKRPESAARAAAVLGPSYRSVYVGDGWKTALPRMREIDRRAVCVPAVDHVGDLLAAFDVAILNSKSEGMSQSLLEYWMAGVPAVATAVGAVNELEQRFGKLIEPIPQDCSDSDLAAAVQQSLSPENLPVVATAQRIARAHFTGARMAQRFTDFVKSVARPTKPVRVGLLTHGLWRGGAEMWLAQLARHLHTSEAVVSSVGVTGTSGIDGPLAREIAAVVPLYGRAATEPPPHGRTHDTGDFRAVLPDAAAVIDEVARDADVLLTWSPGVARQAVGRGRPVVMCSQTSLEEPDPAPLPPGIHLAACSRQAERYYAGRGVDDMPKTVIYSGIPQERITPRRGRAAQRREWGIGDREIVVGFLGRQAPEKGFMTLVRAVPHLPPNYRAVYYGQDQQRAGATHPDLLRFAAEYCPDRVRFYPPVEQMGDLYAGLDVLVSSSMREAFGLVIVEAWLSGVPVVATPCGIAHELRDECGPLAVEIPLDAHPAEVAAAIERAAGSEGRAIAERANRVAEERFTINSMIQAWGKNLERIVRRSKRDHNSA